VFELAVISLDRIVGVLLDVVPCLRDRPVEDGGVDRGGVGDDLGWLDLQRRQRPTEESPGRMSVPAG
jgi:hypothetical protein